MFCLKAHLRAMLNALAGMAMCAMTGAAQTEGPTGQPPPSPPVITVPGPQPEFTTTFTSVTPQYNFAYGPSTSQPLLPTGGFWNDYMPIGIGPSTPGWNPNGEYGTQGIPQAFYHEPYFSGTSNLAGGCSWNQSYNSPPYGFYNSGSGYDYMTGPMLVGVTTTPPITGGSSIASVYQSASQPVSGSGVPVYGFGAMATWEPNVYTPPPEFIGTMNVNTNSCYFGDTEYGFAHLPYYNPPINQFYFDTNSNCPTVPKTGDYECFSAKTQGLAAPQCTGGVNLPTLTGNSQGNYWYFWYIFVSYNSGNGHYLLNAGLQDPYNQTTKWSCTYDVATNTFSNCPGATAPYACPSGSNYPYRANKLYPSRGSVTVGVNNYTNQAPTGGVNPMMQMTTLYVLETAQ